MRCGEALPRIRKRAGWSGRSASRRSTGKQFRQDLDLIQDHQPRKGAQGQLRVLQSALIHR